MIFLTMILVLAIGILLVIDVLSFLQYDTAIGISTKYPNPFILKQTIVKPNLQNQYTNNSVVNKNSSNDTDLIVGTGIIDQFKEFNNKNDTNTSNLN